MSNLMCECRGPHVRVTVQGREAQEGVHIVGWDSGKWLCYSGSCPREATEEDGFCDPCRVFLYETEGIPG
jgi:hypothetical protein